MDHFTQGAPRDMKALLCFVSLLFCIGSVGYGCWFVTHRQYPILPLEETVSDCSWETQSVDAFNNKQLYPLLDRLCERTFFTYWKVNYWRDCEIWEEEDQECSVEPGSGGGCQICPCDNDEVTSCIIYNHIYR